MKNPFRYFNSSPEVIRLTVMMYIRYPLSLRQVEDLLFERGIDICHETVRFWWNRFGPMFAAEIRKRRVQRHSYSQWRWHLDEVFVRINGETHYLWRAVDHEGEVLEVFATKRRDRKAALKFLKRTMKRYGRPWSLAQQPSGKLPPAVPKEGGSDGQIQGHQDPTEIRLCSRLDSQPFQSLPSPKPPRRLQAEPICRSGRMASASGLTAPMPRTFETDSISLTRPKQALLINLLKRPKGATVTEMAAKTGWQAHSVRGSISGTLKKKLGLAVTSAVVEARGRVYRISGGR
jgi:hypothetical protein